MQPMPTNMPAGGHGQRRPRRFLPVLGLVLAVLAICGCAALAVEFMLAGTSTGNVVTERHDDAAAIESRFPVLEGHVTQADYVTTRMGGNSRLPGPNDYTIWGIVTIDGELAERLRNDYRWEFCEAPSLEGELDGAIDKTRTWVTSPALRDEICGREVPSESLLAFDGKDTLVFRRVYY